MDKALFLEYIDETPNIKYVQDFVELLNFKEDNPLYVFRCKLELTIGKVDIFLLIPKRFPEYLPKFFLGKFDRLGFMPHIESNGTICFLEKESIYINRDEPNAVFQASVELAIETLEDGLSGKNHNDFREEFHVFWEQNQYRHPLGVVSQIKVGSEPKRVSILKDHQRAVVIDESDNESRHRRFFKKNPMKKSGIYLLLSESSKILPPKYDEQWSIEIFTKWIKTNSSVENWTKVEKILSKKSSKYEYIIIGIPRVSGETILVGVHLKPKKSKAHPFKGNDSDWGLNYLRVVRFDPPSILPRSGAKSELQNKAVLLIGCGSVGSHIAVDLAKMGIGNLSLIDDDQLKMENIHRFSVGFEYVNTYKVNTLTNFISKNFIFSKLKPYSLKLETFIDENIALLSSFDLIISATGDPTINMFLNEKLQQDKIPLITAWNEPYSIGGHAQLSIPPKKGCYKCLYRDLYNTASFAAKDQPKPFHKKHLGCGEVFTPFNALDSSRTAELTTRLATSFLLNKDEMAQIISWKGDSKEFIQNGFYLSSRYLKQTAEDLTNRKHNFINPLCNHCS